MHFADDTNLFHFGDSLSSVSADLNTDLSLLCDWLFANKISLNADKTEMVLFKSRRKTFDTEPLIILNGHRLAPSPSIRYLGVLLDQHLSWSYQISDLSLKLKRANGALSRIRHYLPQHSLVNVYHAIFNSHMLYACQLWGQWNSVHSRRILSLQKYALRLISFANTRDSSSPLFSKFGILKIFDLVKVLNVLFIRKFLNYELPLDLYNTFNFYNFEHSYNTRSKKLP